MERTVPSRFPSGSEGSWRRARRWVVCGSVLAFLGSLGSGCASTSLKEANRRLKESNDRLISENNRLEEELAALQKRPVDGRGPETMVAADLPLKGTARPNDPRKLLIDPEVEIFETSQGIKLRVPDRVFFGLGQATLSARGQKVLDSVAKLINGQSNHLVRVDGHTDDTPIRKVRHLYPTNWELSSARACTVVRYLVDRGGVDARRIFPAGFSYYRPVASGKTTDAKSKNRRVEITILNESA